MGKEEGARGDQQAFAVTSGEHAVETAVLCLYKMCMLEIEGTKDLSSAAWEDCVHDVGVATCFWEARHEPLRLLIADFQNLVHRARRPVARVENDHDLSGDEAYSCAII